MSRQRPLAPGTAVAWKVSLGAGLVVALVVWGLLERLRRAVGGVEHDLTALWTSGKQLAQQTQAAHLLQAVGQRGGELAAEAAHLRPPAGGPS